MHLSATTVAVALIAISSFMVVAFALPRPSTRYNTYSEPKANVLNVHLVPHTHDDVGWLKTPDQYFAGLNNSIQDAKVQFILDTVIEQLEENPNRKFIYVEVYFFKRWWDEQSLQTQTLVKQFVQEGRLEFILGGVVMSDEAATHYVATIDQMTVGHRFLLDNFGVHPRVAWHIDPFGHSSEFASLFAQMGFDGFFYGRIDHQDKDKRLAEQNMETVWRGSLSLGADSELFSGLNFNGYGPPDGFCFDQYCGDDSIQDDARLEDFNVQGRVDDFVSQCLDQAKHYRSNNIMLTMGSDFQYSNAKLWFKNLDKLIHYVNLDGRVNVFYSTPSIYLDSLHAANLTWSYKTDDFFPYSDGSHAYWTGYFTSRVALKGYERVTSSYLQSCKQLESIVGFSSSANSETLRLAHAVLQHHDGVSGTEKQHVAYDYAKRVSAGVAQCEQVINAALAKLSQSPATSKFSQCPLLNVSVCAVSETYSSFSLIAYNPVAFDRTHLVRLPVPSASYSVYDGNGKLVNSQIVSNTGAAVRPRSQVVGDGLPEIAPYTLIFPAAIPATGFSQFTVNRTSATPAEEVVAAVHVQRSETTASAPNADTVVENQKVVVTFDGVSGRLKSLTNKISNVTTVVSQDFLYYNSSWGTSDDGQASGAYIFRPNRTDPFAVNGNPISITVVRGSLVQEVRQVFADWVTQVVRLYDNAFHVEFEWTVGPIPYAVPEGKEVISRFSTDLRTSGVFYTDSNGREMQTRVRNYRQSYQLNVTEPVAGNYYPVNSRIFARDATDDRQFTILTDRSLGGASINDGQLELMVHRRLFYDDSRGVGEPLNETGIDGNGLVARGTFYVVLDTAPNSARAHRLVGLLAAQPAVLAFAPLAASEVDAAVAGLKAAVPSWSALAGPLPQNLNLLTLEVLDYAPTTLDLLLRIEHFYAVNEDSKYSVPVTFDLSTLFSNTTLAINSVTELTLSANRPKSDLHRLVWSHTSSGQEDERVLKGDPVGAPAVFTFNPMQIRTFQINVRRA